MKVDLFVSQAKSSAAHCEAMFKVVVVTGTRAEYGLLRPVIQKIDAHPRLQLQLVVTGAHLAPEYGSTVTEIEADGWPIAAKVDILGQPVPPGRAGTARRTALALDGMLGAFAALKPNAVLLLGDRYEAFAAGQAAALLDIPLVHISGGDVTHGADDDWFRHCLTKMAKLHFPSCEAYRRREIRMGEAPGTVFNVGGLGDENIRSLCLLDFDTLRASLGVPLKQPYALVTFHPETATGRDVALQADALLAAMEAHPELFYLITKANADAGGAELNARLEAFCATHENAALFASLGVLRYLSAMKHAALVLGNSSSGVVETPSFGVPAVDIGLRQAGRETGANVLHCRLAADEIAAAIATALTPEFTATARAATSPYAGGDTSGQIVEILAQKLESGTLQEPKIFYDGE